MWATVDVPPFADEMHERGRSLAGQLAPILGPGESQHFKPGSDVFSEKTGDCALVENGVLRFYFREKLIRIFTTGDWLIAHAFAGLEECRLEADFPSTLRTFSHADVARALANHPDRIEIWLEMQAVETQLLHVLCGSCMEQEIQPQVQIREFAAGDVLLREGETSGQIAELVEGRATATIGGTTVGQIAPGELFGEIGFLTDQPSVATVTAVSNCLVQLIDRGDFTRLIRGRPHLMLNLARTLATRVADLDRRVAGP